MKKWYLSFAGGRTPNCTGSLKREMGTLEYISMLAAAGQENLDCWEGPPPAWCRGHPQEWHQWQARKGCPLSSQAELRRTLLSHHKWKFYFWLLLCGVLRKTCQPQLQDRRRQQGSVAASLPASLWTNGAGLYSLHLLSLETDSYHSNALTQVWSGERCLKREPGLFCSLHAINPSRTAATGRERERLSNHARTFREHP